MKNSKLIWIGAVLVALVAGFVAYRMFGPAPSGTDFSRSRASAKGFYLVSIAPEKEPFVRSALHSWIVTIKTASGEPVIGAALKVGGGMPQHGHGLPTEPRMTADLGGGRYRIDGAKFSMFGWWEFKFDIKARQGDDAVVFNLNL